ncbi:MAG: GMC family oxidoreductase [Shewanella psychromarinicola]|uniref:GMC family oxidoreductase n=1 Tax=Shewanella psychromarinicola TaxID=2487742 RepID=A0A3N4E8J0_9GAMM|nr:MULTISPECIES: GMC family oxidoreductase [Shewanella]AZG34946.1 GMC family oxidoreductase [Shewanella psychromarinicola]MCL1080634.1 GMC family oxidoreductase [Shewanella psychromarinicola]PKG79943.1 GMC family oxidoreductase [Shewanella sp. Actino-trap-3]RPA33257.1 GMC family oxidoreductase [Shewanella psychromarinicola]
MAIIDPIITGLNDGWHHIDASRLEVDRHFEADVVIVGTGAGGGTAAEILTEAGLKVIMIEGGALKSSTHFDMEERHAYPNLYQQAAAMKTADKGIGIFQGRTVGGSTTVNWTTSIRTPEQTLAYWEQEKSVKGLSSQDLLPWFEMMEQRLNIEQWQYEPNRNNGALLEGCEKLGWDYTVIKRNVKGCWNTGYCGMGCPVNAKQSMLVTTIPAALDKGATLISRARVIKLEHKGDQVVGLTAQALTEGLKPTSVQITFSAKHYILSAGAIHTPTILMRSNTPDPHKQLGKTFLHPSLLSGGIFAEQINGHSGAPQSIYSDEFVWRDGAVGDVGYKLEVAPVHPVLIASKTIGYGVSHAQLMANFNQMQVTIALIRDGFNQQCPGGQVRLTDTSFALDYPLNQGFWDGARRAFLSMAELQFAAGAKKVLPMHDGLSFLNSWSEAKQVINNVDLGLLKTIVASAHVMGGCAMGEDKALAMVDGFGYSHYLENLSVMDGSVFPTSLGANPQLSIYGLVARNATALAQKLTQTS